MLRELHISNLAVITDVRIALGHGLNCFTGATGAGKSLVIGAIEVLLGLRSPSEMLRPGADEGRVSGVFEVRGRELLHRLQALTDIPLTEDGGEVLLTRRLYASGRSSVSLNGHPITLAMLKQVAEHLVDVHGQHDHQYLLKPSNQLDVIDQFGELTELRSRYHATYLQVVETRQRIVELAATRTLRRQQLELYRFQADEIDAAALDVAEYQELQSRASVLTNLEKLKRDAGTVHAVVYEADGSVLERLKGAASILMELGGLDANLQPVAQAMRDATIQVEEAAYDLSRYLDKLDLDPAELAEVNDRLNNIQRVIHKYGDTVEATLAYREELRAHLAELEKASDDDSGLQAGLAPMLAELRRLGSDLTTRRIAVAKELSPLVERQLGDLGMEKARFHIALTPAVTASPAAVAASSAPAPSAAGREIAAAGRGGKFGGLQTRTAEPEAVDLSDIGTPSGFDQIEFIAQTNPGQLAQPLRKIASGGELSRIMLALKGILAQGDRISVLVFDEIDSNVGGRLGSIIGNKLRSLAEHHQVLCITHLPQIASYADQHLSVRKEVINDKTETKVRVMKGDERVQELAEMTGGQHITPTTLAQARELLEVAQGEFKNSRRKQAAAAPTPPDASASAGEKAPAAAKVSPAKPSATRSRPSAADESEAEAPESQEASTQKVRRIAAPPSKPPAVRRTRRTG